MNDLATKPKQKKSGLITIGIVAGAIVIVGILIFAGVFNSNTTSPPPRTQTSGTIPAVATVVVPNVVGLTPTQALEALSAADLQANTTSGSAPTGTVTGQSPAAGTTVTDHSIVTVTVSPSP
ncbi:MAG TPA: PASTA domain-containing protein [Acidimicrobiales bacterium]|jgi:flagellar basal body-associated protein FliL|nr:PASTA domain-containing protein [Acidimicrobiales bacterium]